MNPRNSTPHEDRVLVLAPTDGDAALTQMLLTEAGLECHICPNLPDLCREFCVGAAAILLTEEILVGEESNDFVEVLRGQTPWSDMPVLLLTSSGSDSPVAAWAMDLLGNVTVLERPIRVTTLISTLRTALRARRRQYELRSQVEAIQKQGERLRLLWEAAAVLLTTEQPSAMMRGIFARIAPHFGLDAYFNFMVNEAEDALRMESCMGISDEAAHSISRLHFGQAICGTVALRRQSMVATSIQKSEDPKVQLVKSFGLRVYACNPLMAGDRLLGTLSFASRKKDAFEADELEFLQTICHYVAYAYERLRLIRQLREEDVKKDEFLATLAHELRNPLAPIRNAAQYLQLKGPSDLDFRNARDIIDRQVEQMTRLVDDLLDISRITRGKMVLQRERLSLALVLTNAIESSRPLIEENGHKFSFDRPPQTMLVDGDGTRLAQVFSNLLTNSAKYTDRGGRIHLSAKRQGSDAVVSVIDNGIGIAPEHLPRVFDMFSQVDPALERTQGGLGIGLALVRRLAEMHGGQVEARSEGLGKGCEFVVRLPLLIETPKAPQLENRVDETIVSACDLGCRILVADDNLDSAKTLAMLLTAMGHEVRTAHNGLVAVEVADGFQPEVILLDIGMPIMNGYDAARQIRRQPWSGKTVLVALTGWGQDDDKRRAEDAGFDHHFTKPVDYAALAQLLNARSDVRSKPR